MRLQMKHVRYAELNAKQKENYNFQKVSAVLADYGYVTIRLTDDWQGADFIAKHIDGTFVKVQLKARPAFAKKYRNKDLYIAFCDGCDWYLYPHDEVLNRVLATTTIAATLSWAERGGYSWKAAPPALRKLLANYKLTPAP